MATPPELPRRLGDGYRADTRRLADRCAADVGGWWDRTDGAGVFPVVAALTVAVANRRSVTLAAIYLADSLTLAVGEPVLVADLDADLYADQAHLRRVLTKADRFQAVRIATDEPLAAGRAALRHAQKREPRVRGLFASAAPVRSARPTTAPACPLVQTSSRTPVATGNSARRRPSTALGPATPPPRLTSWPGGS